MLTSTDKPQPRLRIWDRVIYKGSSVPIELVVIGIGWDSGIDDYEIEMIPYLGSDLTQYARDSDPMLRLISRPGIVPQVLAETPQQKVERLKQEYWERNDKSWFDKAMELDEAEKAAVVAEAKGPPSLDIRLNSVGCVSAPANPPSQSEIHRNVLRLYSRLQSLDNRMQRVEEVVGTNPAPDNKDG
jgi:hypothetical protein